MKTLITAFVIIVLMSCNDAKSSKNLASKENDATVISVELDSKTHILKTIDWQRSTAEFSTDKIYLQLEEEGNPILFTLMVEGINTNTTHSGTYKLPEANANKKTIYLSFFDTKRKVKALNRRIEFKEGDIDIKRLSKDKLEMTFNGQGSGVMEHDLRFDIKGFTTINLQTIKN